MADKYLNQTSADRSSVYDTPNLNTNVVQEIRDRGQGWQKLVTGLDKFLNNAHQQLDKKTVRAAQEAGSMAGLAPDFRQVEGDSLAAENYNRAGTEVFINRKLSDVSVSINKIQIDPAYRNDPVKMQHVLEDQQADFIKDIPIQAVPEFMVAYKDRMNRAIQSAQQNKMELTLSANAAAFMEMESALVPEITNAARDGNEEAVAQARTEYFNRIDAQVGLTLTPLEASKKKMIIQKQVQIDAVVGNYLRTAPEDRATFMESFIKDNPLKSIMTPDELDDTKRHMIQAANVDENLMEAANEEKVKLQKETVDLNKADFYLAPTTDNYTKLVTTPGVDADDIKAARTYLNSYGQEPDPVAIDEIENLIYQGNYADANTLLNEPEYARRLGQKGQQSLRATMSEVQAGFGFEKTESYREVLRRIDEDYSSEMGLSSAGKVLRQQIYDKMRVDYPKFLRGEISFDDVDPVRMYSLKRANSQAAIKENAGQTVQTKEGPVVIPKKWLDDPAQFDSDRRLGIDKRYDNVEVQKFMAEQRLKKDLEEAKGAK